MDDPNITMEEYIRLEEEKARRHVQTFNWQTATFEKVENYEDEDDCSIDFETEFLAIVFDNTLTTITSEPTICPPHENKATASLSEYDEEIFSRFNDLFNIIHPYDSKSEKDNDDNDIGIIQSSEDNEITHGKNGLSKTSHYNTIRTFETGSFVMNLKGFAAALAVLVTGASQSRQHESHHRFFPVDTSLIQIESRKSPTKSLIDVGSRRISIFTVNTKEYHSDVLAIITRIMRRT
ncbi:hypothetical protein Tco_1530961 [Tanacetum coccineum]